MVNYVHVCMLIAGRDTWSRAPPAYSCESIQVDMVGVVDVSKALENIIAIWQHICLPVCACVWIMGIWSKVNIPRDCASIQVGMVWVVDVAKALESITAIC